MFLLGRNLLLLASVMSFSGSILHIVVVLIGAPAYQFFGGSELAMLAESGSLVPAAMTLSLAVIFMVFGLYALSGAGVIRRLPMIGIGLIVIGGIYTFRGLSIIEQTAQLILEPESIQIHKLLYSLISLLTGCAYLLGAIKGWTWIHSGSGRNGDAKKSHLEL